MEQKKLFPTRLFGYKKKAVNMYLLESGEKAVEKLNEQFDRIDTLVQENHDLKMRVSALESENKTLNSELAEYRSNKEVIASAILNAERQASDVVKAAELKKVEIETETEAATEALKKLYDSKAKEMGGRPVVRLKRPK